MMAERLQKEELREVSSSGTLYTALGPDETSDLSQPARGIGSTTRHYHGSSGYDASGGSATGGLEADIPSNTFLTSLPSTRASARAADGDHVGGESLFPFRSYKYNLRRKHGRGMEGVARLTESAVGQTLELERSVEAIANSQKVLPLTYVETIPMGKEEERLLNRDASEELLAEQRVGYFDFFIRK